jgi:hypothetical protein
MESVDTLTRKNVVVCFAVLRRTIGRERLETFIQGRLSVFQQRVLDRYVQLTVSASSQDAAVMA